MLLMFFFLANDVVYTALYRDWLRVCTVCFQNISTTIVPDTHVSRNCSCNWGLNTSSVIENSGFKCCWVWRGGINYVSTHIIGRSKVNADNSWQLLNESRSKSVLENHHVFKQRQSVEFKVWGVQSILAMCSRYAWSTLENEKALYSSGSFYTSLCNIVLC